MAIEPEPKTLLPIAQYLIEKSYRYLEPKQAGYIAGRFKVSRQQVEAAAILADRIRRMQQHEDYLAGRVGVRVVLSPEPECIGKAEKELQERSEATHTRVPSTESGCPLAEVGQRAA